MRSESALRERRAQAIPTNGRPASRSHHPILHINRRGNPPQLSFSHDGKERQRDPEHLARRELFFKAINGDLAAIGILRNTYHLTHLVLGRRIIIKNNMRNGNNRRPVASTPTRRSHRRIGHAR